MRIGATIAGLATALALGACGGLSMPDFESFRVPDTGTMFRPYSVSSFRDKPLAPITPEDLVDSEGRCAGAVGPADASGDPATTGQIPSTANQPPASPQDGAFPPVASGVSLEMTECEVVRRLGAPQRVEIGGDAGQRTAMLTFLGGMRPGIYHFIGGRLRSMERAPEPPPEQKPAKRSPRRKQTVNR